ncbi:isochorismatase family protein [Streptomyces sp. NPDC020875]|uniref:isochorismatase family protein n=1 Tax=Streptomyces sp. NPDC020875 TaxID=3154898 RepID=UPI0033EA5DEA
MSHRAALLVIDVQNAMVGIAHRPAPVLAAIAGLRERAIAAGVPVVTVQHGGGGLEPGTEAWRIAPAVAPGDGETVVHKASADSFLGTELDAVLKESGVTEVVVTGFATEICVDTAARQALSHGYDVLLVEDGHMTSVRPEGSPYAAPDASVAHHNEIFRTIRYPGRAIRVLPADGVDFAAPPASARQPAS